MPNHLGHQSPDNHTAMSSDTRPLIIACGALATELRAVLRASGVEDSIEVKYLAANLHNRPENITPQVAELLEQNDSRPIFVAYADCGTGGHLDLLLKKYPKVSRLPGAHCYEFFAGTNAFLAAHDEEPGTFYLTDFLAKHFDALVWQGLGLQDHPELLNAYFGNYRRVVLFSQTVDQDVVSAGREAAQRLGLAFEHRHTGMKFFSDSIPVSFKSSTKSSKSLGE